MGKRGKGTMRTIINNLIDVAKGGLIFLVVFGHLLLGSLNNKLSKVFYLFVPYADVHFY